MRIIVIGAGLAGLTCAKVLTERGIYERLPDNRTGTPGLVLAGEYTEDSSINGPMFSGERAEVVRA